MTTGPVATIADEQLAEAEQRHTILLQRGQSLRDALCLPAKRASPTRRSARRQTTQGPAVGLRLRRRHHEICRARA